MKYTTTLFTLLLLTIGLGVWYAHMRRSSDPSERQAATTIVVGTSADFPPFSYKQEGRIVGFDIDIVEDVMRRLGMSIELEDMPFETLLSAAQIGSIAVIAAGLSVTPERAQRLLFARPHYTGDALVMVSVHDQPTRSLDALANKRIVVNEGYVADTYISAIPGLMVTRLKTVADALLALQAGHADVFVSAASAIKPFFEQQRAQGFVYTVIPHTAESYALAVSKRYPALYTDIERVITEMLEDGTIDHYKKKWGLTA